jgi:hypothetical protein
VIGPILDRHYAQTHAAALTAPHVELVGELAGQAKLDQLRQAAVMVYTCAPDYVEAGAAVFGESLRSGTPIAALAWRPGTCADAALCADTGTLVDTAGVDEDEAAERLADAVNQAERLDAQDVQYLGLRRFDPQRHVEALLTADAA